MKRYITMETENGVILAFTESENWRESLEGAHEWVWQFADSKAQAIAQHDVKFTQWQDETDAGKSERDTY